MQARIHRSRVVVTCSTCGYHRRYPLYRNIS
jgi:RNase P subunit RPR2